MSFGVDGVRRPCRDSLLCHMFLQGGSKQVLMRLQMVLTLHNLGLVVAGQPTAVLHCCCHTP